VFRIEQTARRGADTFPGLALTPPATGTQWIVDAHGCDPEALRSPSVLANLFARIVAEMGLHPVGEAVWHVFPGPGGITGFLILSESHLACHTFPERGFAAFDLYCCRPLPGWAWPERLREAVRAADVRVRCVPRGEPGETIRRRRDPARPPSPRGSSPAARRT
jgi:S-adenosylmethionine decarboxylase